MSDKEWQKRAITQKIKCVRTGWLGAWDALVSAVTGKERLSVLEDVTFSVYVKGYAELTLTQAESGAMPKAYKQEHSDDC